MMITNTTNDWVGATYPNGQQPFLSVPIVAQAVSAQGFTYGMDGNPGWASGALGGQQREGGFVPPHATVPYYLSLDVPHAATGLTVRLGVDSDTSDNSYAPASVAMTVPVESFSGRSSTPSLDASGATSLSKPLVQGPLSVLVQSPHLVGPCVGSLSKNAWRVEATLAVTNNYGYALWNGHTFAEVVDSAGGIWGSFASVQAWNPVPPGGTANVDLTVDVQPPPEGCNDPAPLAKPMYLLLVLPGTEGDSTGLSSTAWAYYNLGVLKAK